jgi:hypothetical protein
MKNYQIMLCAAIAALSSCSVGSHTSQADKTDSLNTETKPDSISKELLTEMSMPNTVKVGDSVLLNFTVKNNTDSVQRFCKWHTPFEPLLSKYLDVKNDKGEDMAYQGVMAKRMMPPPESSYISLKPQDSVMAKADLLKAYAIKAPGKYTITYVGGNMSGLKVKNSISFVYSK